jgi:DNA (cytosine-5)-methyltransferase 1
MKNINEINLTDSISTLEEEEQLRLFAQQDSNLKYPRREKRTISKVTYKLSKPSASTSKAMQKIQSENTALEKKFEYALIRERINYCKAFQLIESIEGNPDFIIPRFRIAIFCDGDFWHGYNFDKEKITNNNEFWSAKIEKNILRDSEVTYGLQNTDWKVFRFWEHEINKDVDACIDQIKSYINENFPEQKHLFTFVDLFAGIGGFRIPLEALGGKCLGFSEIDKNAIDTYKNNFLGFKNSEEIELGSITNLRKLPFQEIDLIVGGVPCQSWSVAGKMRGFDDPRGKLWNDSIRIVELNKPKAFIFENVKGLIDPRNKANLDLIVDSLENLGYRVKFKLLNSYDFGLPQNRDRILIVGIRKDLILESPFGFPKPNDKKSFLYEIIDGFSRPTNDIKKKIFDPKEIFGEKIPMGRNRFQKINEFNDFFILCDTRNGHTTIHSWDMIRTSKREKEICMTILKNRRKKIYGHSDGNPITFEQLSNLIPSLKNNELKSLVEKKILKYIENQGYVFVNSKNSSGINGIYRIYLPHSNIFSTLTATGTKDVIALKNIHATSPSEYKKVFLEEIIKPRMYRQISSKEAGKLQGFPKWFAVHPDEKIAKKQFGNAVSTTVIYNLAQSIINTGIFRTHQNEQKGKGRNPNKV